jgi:hypothetical protein
MPTPFESLYPETKICSNKDCPLAGIPQPLDNFHRNANKKSGHADWCKECRKAYVRAHPPKRYVPSENDATSKICRKKDCVFGGVPQPIGNFNNDISKKDGHSSNCKACTYAKNKEWKDAHFEWYKKYDWKEAAKRFRSKDWARFILIHTKSRAKRNGIPFNIDKSDILPAPDYCPVFGIKLDYTGGKDRRSRASLDRVKPELGYTKGNVRIISFAANTAKQNGIGDIIQPLKPKKERRDNSAQQSLFDL